MRPITSKDGKTQNHPEHGWWRISKLWDGWHSNLTCHCRQLFKAKLPQISDANSIRTFGSNTHSPCCLSSLGTENFITLGCFLIAAMASLRFRDLLRSKPESLSIQGHILRGISRRTKTSVSGQRCVTTRPSIGHWVFRFLEALQIGMEKSREYWGPKWSSDFLLPSWTLDWFSSFLITVLLSPWTCFDQISVWMQLVITSFAHTRTSL